MKTVIEKDPIAFQVKTFFWILIFAITTTASLVGVYWGMNNKIDNYVIDCEHVKEIVGKHSTMIVVNESRLAKVENTNTKIETDLAWIKAALTQIQQQLK